VRKHFKRVANLAGMFTRKTNT